MLVKLKTQNLVPRIRTRGAVPPFAFTLYVVVLIRLGDYFGKNLIVLLTNMRFQKRGKLRQKYFFWYRWIEYGSIKCLSAIFFLSLRSVIISVIIVLLLAYLKIILCKSFPFWAGNSWCSANGRSETCNVFNIILFYFNISFYTYSDIY